MEIRIHNLDFARFNIHQKCLKNIIPVHRLKSRMDSNNSGFRTTGKQTVGTFTIGTIKYDYIQDLFSMRGPLFILVAQESMFDR